MYILKNAYTNITRMKGRNLVIGIIITCITISACIALSIEKSGGNLIASYKDSNPVEVTFGIERSKMTPGSEQSTTTTVQKMTVSDIKKYADSDYVTSYYYTLESTVSSNDITAISDSDTTSNEDETTDNNRGGMKMMNMGDYRLTAYSDASYITEFTEGTKKMTSGSMFTLEDTENEMIISEALAEANELEVGDEITFYSPNDEDTTYTFTIVGLYEDNTDTEENSFMKMNAMNSSNQIYTTISAMQKVLDTTEDNMGPDQGLTAKFYLEKASDVEAFTIEVQKKGLDSNYTARTNEEELMATLSPIEQISKFSGVFVVIILVVGALILSVINLLHIRERKYEIGVLRSIGMSKWKVSLQIVSEIFIVAMVSLMIGTGVGMITSQPVANYLLKEQIANKQAETETAVNNFGSDKFSGGPGSEQKETRNRNRFGKDVEYVDHLAVQIDGMTILELFGCSLILVLTSSFISIMNINKYEPNKILQSRN